LSGLTEAELRYGEYYVHYDEDIYMGYRYYETRYIAEGGNGGDWYRENVVYPFGHGLSYTDFSWEVTGSQPDGGNLDKDGKIALTVRVTNTGTRAGKDVVQLYYNAPYYAGGIAKAHVVLGNFEKTKLLAPGDFEDVVVELKVSDMYSYDWSDANGNGFKGYELEAGAYNIIAAHDAHDAAQLPEERAVTYGIEGGFRYDTDTTTGAAVANLFDYASGAGKTNDPQTFKGVRQYMSRDDFEGTFPTHALAKQTGLRQGNRAFTMSGDADEPWYTDVMPVQAAAPGTSATNTVKLWHMKGRSYDDPLWDDLLNQLTVEEMANQIGNGFRGPREIASIDKPTVWDTDGPLGRRESQDIQWAGNPILAQSFNRDLAYRQGVLFGNAVFTGPNGRGGTYGVGLNIHRSPFAGRAFEYYSEDGLVAGSIGSEVIAGSLTKGGYQVAKHLMLNDQETERNTVQTWVSEQALREIYGKGFELGVKLGGLNALMTGVDAIGDIYCSLNYNLLEGLVRGEWGFQGFIITDMKCEDTNISMRAGIDTMMSYPAPKPPVTNAESLTPTHVASMRRAVKNIFFTMANTTGINGVGGDRLERINYIGANALYSVQGVDNKLSVASALVKNDPGAELTYALRAGSSLPDGMTLEADGTLGGAPAEAGTYTFSVAASEKTDAYYPYKDANKIFRLTVYAQNRIPDQIIYEDVDLGVIPSGFYYSKSIKGAVVFGPDGKLGGDVAYSLAEGSRLPDGLALEDGILGGNVTANSGVYFFTVEASYAGKQSALLDFIVRVKRNDIVYGSTPIADLTVGRSAVISVASAYNDDGIPIKYAVKDGSKLPDGLTLQSNGIITGTPTRAYNGYKFSVLATGENAPATEAEFSVNVLGVVFGDVAYDGLIIGKAYKFNLGASPNNGTSADIYYELKEGSALPNGFKLLADGTLYGVGDTWGAQSFTVVAKSEGNATVEASVTLDFYTVFEDPLEDEEVVPPPAAPAAKGCGSAAAAALLAGAFVICFGIKFSLTGVYK
jgi:beta-glucosidase